jgi:hemolysin
MPHTMEQLRHLTLRSLPLAIASALLAPCSAAWADGLTAFAGGDAVPIINGQYKVPVIDIVAPNANGLSHNVYSEYNVGTEGLVLNNSLVAGKSEMAGELQANPQLGGTAASTILNEVVGHNRSNINGPQVVFGAAADYVLANPNGITLNGASLVNAPRATFVVGSATVQDGRLTQFDTQAADELLRVDSGGASNRAGSLALIAPSIVSSGPIAAGADIDLVLGSNVVDYANNGVIGSTRTTKLIDANLLGAMTTDKRIRIVSSEEGAGIRMPGARLTAGQGIRIESAGDLNLHAPARAGKPQPPAELNGGAGDIHLAAGRQLNLGAARLASDADVRLIADSVRSQGADIDSGGLLKVDATSMVNTGSSRLQGGTVSLDVSGKLADTGTDYTSTLGKIAIHADSHDMKAAMHKVQAGAATTSTPTVGSLSAAEGIDIRLTGSGRYEGSRIGTSKGPVQIEAGANLAFNPAHAILDRLGKDGAYQQRTASKARIDAPGDVILHAGGDVQLNGTDIGTLDKPAGSLKVTAGGTLTSLAAVDKTTLKGGGESKSAEGLHTFGQRDESTQHQHGNQWQVKGDMALQAGARKAPALHLQGVQAEAQSMKLAATAGGVYLESASDQRQLDRKQLSADASDPLKPALGLSYRNEQQQTHHGARLRAATLRLDSQMDARLDGARLQADTLSGTVKGKLAVTHRADSTQMLGVEGRVALAEGTAPGKMLNEVAALGGKWNSPVKEALALEPNAGKSEVEQATFEFTRTDKTGVNEQSGVFSNEPMTLKVARGTTHATAAGAHDLQTSHTITTSNADLDAVKRLYEQARIR